MFELIWTFINIAIFIYLLFICFELLKLIKTKIGFVKTIVLTIGFISIISKNTNNENDSIELLNETSINSEKYKIEETIESNIISKIKLSLFYSNNKNEVEFTSAKTEKFGLTSGTELKIHSIAINKAEINKKYNYNILGSKEWKLLGIGIYTENKEYEGEFKVK
ncbi:hypothetical protein [Empedobacter tilapiae]|uniref:Uncharacterized protein n=1 Tax=Empedobacter tilapiae TaxID=2491114 RepID=A0A4Z1BVM0_9FLAO|nr:hypothetical protein [Empedobacter tilapiae]TGN24481.1 hypothetical protein E4J94_12575 [Empedobacter tilapiae]